MRSYFVIEVVRCAFSYGCYQMEVFQGLSESIRPIPSFPGQLRLIFSQPCSRTFSISATRSLAARWLWRASLRPKGWGCFDL